jgi:hypothetical protein
MALLGRGKPSAPQGTLPAPANGKATGKVVTMPRARGPLPGSTLTATQVKVGMKVRVWSLEGDDRPSREVFTIQPFDKGEKAVSPEWFAIDDRRQVHVGDLRLA